MTEKQGWLITVLVDLPFVFGWKRLGLGSSGLARAAGKKVLPPG
jgi:hypothetical protein